jgi:hypothetical protein
MQMVGGMIANSPAEVVAVARSVAEPLAEIIRKQKLYTKIRGREYVHVEGWTTCAAMLGLTCREVSVERHDDGSYEAVVELVRMSDGVPIGRGSHVCGGPDDNPWNTRQEYAKRSMAVTRAAGKACRLSLSWIVALTGYSTTPAEEMPHDTPRDSPEVPRTPRKSQKPPQDAHIAPELTKVVDTLRDIKAEPGKLEAEYDDLIDKINGLRGVGRDLYRKATPDQRMQLDGPFGQVGALWKLATVDVVTCKHGRQTVLDAMGSLGFDDLEEATPDQIDSLVQQLS